MQYPRTISATQMRIINQSAVLELLRREPTISRSDIGRKLNVSLPTVMRIIDDLIERNLVVELDEKEYSGGRRKQLLQFNQEDNVIIGIDLGGMSVYAAMAEIGGKIIADQKFPLAGLLDSEADLFCLLFNIIHEYLDMAQKQGKKVLGVGIGAPGITRREDGVVIWAPSTRWRNFPLKKKIQDEFPNLTILVDNDANLAALGEQWFGAGHNYRNILFLSLGGGTGGAVILDGMLYRGAHSAAGEVGSSLLSKENLTFVKERYGALEMSASGNSILAMAHTALKDQLSQAELEAVDLEMVQKAFAAGEIWATAIVSQLIDSIAVTIVNAASLIDPEVVILYGQVTDAFNQNNYLVNALEKRIRGLPPFNPTITASLLGKKAVIMGTITDVLYLTNNFFTVREAS
ncbi:MAG: ROK family transcriptional regulator [Anaerolineaceae bacterium]|nr:ROK family transcriptional regulator [Anaerolineaceae bacterium]